MSEFRFGPLTQQCIDAFYTVYRYFKYHPGCSEADLQTMLAFELRQRGLTVETQLPVTRQYRGQALNQQMIDVLVTSPDGPVLIEIKKAQSNQREYGDQLYTYLQDMDLLVGLLFVFSTIKPIFRRIDRKPRTGQG